ncbi:hypothetical protein BJ878DRAFT_209106 [Calycina marina]|uniref:Uncharacterized protein n=1 Tax=Calycina marina TaxID=1763456 RepID=A0A9P8CHE2_9HELO|nr:hypothetical protein BJ878DRAFT_209106 [Calycina marina]
MQQNDLDSDTGKSALNMGGATKQWDSADVVWVTNITISNSITAFPISQQFVAHIEGNQNQAYCQNLWVSAHNRKPGDSKANSQYINNVVYNYQAAYTAANTGSAFSHGILNDYFIAEPSTTRQLLQPGQRGSKRLCAWELCGYVQGWGSQ